MLVVDLFCGAGGAALGIRAALPDARIVGVDVAPQPRYPYTFECGDALAYPLNGADFVWASPPCQHYTTVGYRVGDWQAKYPDLVARTREMLDRWGGPYIIENVPSAPLLYQAQLCGLSFGLGVLRHRRFESNHLLLAPAHQSHRGIRVNSKVRVPGSRYFCVAGHMGGTLEEWREAMGISTPMTKHELAEAVPPAYAEYLVRQVVG